jgi:hypothetical protein
MASSTSSQEQLLAHIHLTSSTGQRISTSMLTFLNNTPSQPLGFRDLGLTFLEICRILSALEQSLQTHFQTGQTVPERAVPELEKVMGRTDEDFKELEGLLGKFVSYEEGGIKGRLMKTWRMVFADRDVGKVEKSLREGMGALKMAGLLVNL